MRSRCASLFCIAFDFAPLSLVRSFWPLHDEEEGNHHFGGGAGDAVVFSAARGFRRPSAASEPELEVGSERERGSEQVMLQQHQIWADGRTPHYKFDTVSPKVG